MFSYKLLVRNTVPAVFQGFTYMLNLSHNLHLSLYFDIHNAVLDKATFLDLLCCEWYSIILGSYLEYCGKCAFTNDSNFVVPVSTLPLLGVDADIDWSIRFRLWLHSLRK